MNFPDALRECLNGKRITNLNWNGRGMYVEVIPGSPNMFSEMMLPYLEITNVKGDKVPWSISNMDIFSDGWEVIE